MIDVKLPSSHPLFPLSHTISLTHSLTHSLTLTHLHVKAPIITSLSNGIRPVNGASGGVGINGSVSMLVVDQPAAAATTTVTVNGAGGDDGDMGERVTDPVILSKWQRAATSR